MTNKPTRELIAEVRALDSQASPPPWHGVSEQGATDILWSIFQGYPLSRERICSVLEHQNARLIMEYRTLAPELARRLEGATQSIREMWDVVVESRADMIVSVGRQMSPGTITTTIEAEFEKQMARYEGILSRAKRALGEEK